MPPKRPAAFAYRLGNRSALEWVIDQERPHTDPRSGIRHDPHRPSSRSPSVRCRSTSRYGAGENSAKASTTYTTSRAGNSRRRCSARPHAATTRSTKSGGYTQVNTPSPDSSGTPSATGTTPDSAPAAYAPPNATALAPSGSSVVTCEMRGLGLMLVRSREARRCRWPRCASDTSWSYQRPSAPGCTP